MLLESAFVDDKGALPVVSAVEQDDEAAGLKAAHDFYRIACFPRQPEPQHVHRRADFVDGKTCALADRGTTPIAADGEIGPYFDLSGGRVGAHAGDTPALLDEISRFRLHSQMEAGIDLGPLREKIEEVPLGNQCNEFAAGREMSEIRECIFLLAEGGADCRGFLVRQFQELVQQAQLVHELQCGGMDGVAAEIAQEVGVLLQHDHVDAGAREQKAEHEPARPAADHATTR